MHAWNLKVGKAGIQILQGDCMGLEVLEVLEVQQAACQTHSQQLDNRHWQTSAASINTTASCFPLMSDAY